MKRESGLTVLMCCTLVIGFLGTNATADSKKAVVPDEDVVVRIGDESVITAEEFDRGLKMAATARARRSEMTGEPAPGFMSDDERKAVLESMIDARVLSLLAEKGEYDVPERAVEGRIQSLRSRYPSEEAFQESVKEQGLTVDELADRIRKQLQVSAFIQDKTKDITATEEDVAAEYEKQKNQGLLDTVDVAHILIKVNEKDEEAWQEAKKKIDAARERIVKGEDFAEVAKDVSEDPGSAKNGGLFPNTPRGRMVAEFEQVAFSIPEGQLSEAFKTRFGWHILKTFGRGRVPLEDAAPRITKDVTRQKRKDELKRLVDEARAGYKIDVNMPKASDTPLTETTEPNASDDDTDLPLPTEAS